MISKSLRIFELTIFCFFATGAGNFVSLNFGVGFVWIYYILIIGTFFLSALGSKSKFNIDIVWLLILITCLAYASSFLNEVDSITGFTNYLMPILGFLFSYLFVIQSKDRIQTISNYLKISLLILCLSMIMEPFTLFTNFGYLADGLRLSGFAGNANLAAFYIISHLACIKLLLKKVPIMLFLLSIVCLVFTFSRSGILVFTIIYFVEFLKWASYKNKIKSTITTLLVSIFILISIPSENEYLKAFNFSRINPFSQNEFIKEDTSRLDIISVYLNGINERPIFGHGPTQGAKQEVRAHNTTLNIWYEVGIMPTLTFLLFLFFLFFKSYKHLWLMNTFLIYLGFSFFINNLLFHPSFWMLLSCFYIAKDKIDIGPQHTWK